MKKSKHFRKDVIIARVIFGILVIVIGVLIGIGVSKLTKNTDNSDTQQTESQQTEIYDVPQYEETEEVEVETEVEEVVVYAKTTAQVRLRKEPNTNCEVVTSVPAGTKTLMLEDADGWYKVSYNGNEGYIRADYVEIIEETVSPSEAGE